MKALGLRLLKPGETFASSSSIRLEETIVER